jgi:hypothetical protein
MVWKLIERSCIIAGAVFTAVCAYYAMATYYGWNVPAVSPSPNIAVAALSPPWWLYVAGSIGVALIGTGWAMMFERRASLAIVGRTEMPPIAASATPAPAPADNRQWFSSYKIFDLADPTLLQRAVQLQSQLQSLEKEISTNDAAQLALKPTDPLAALEAMNTPIPALEILQKSASELYNRNRAAAANHRAAFGEVLEDIYEKLAAGKLVAKGFLVPVETDSSEIDIPAAHWRLIRFHAAGYTQAEGQGIKYVGITVARAG